MREKMSEKVDLIIRNARLIDVDEPRDIAIKGDRIVIVDRGLKAVSKEEIDAGGKLTSPGFIDAHMHLDHALLGGDAKYNARTLSDSEIVIRSGRRAIDSEGVKNVARRAAKMALRNGTTAIRTHVNVDKLLGTREMEAMLELKKECSSWMDLQIVAFPSGDALTESDVTVSNLRKAMEMGADVVGGLPNVDKNWEKYLDIIFDVAKDFNAIIDLHVDESNDPNDRALELYAEKTMENGWEGKVSASHCCALSAYSDDYAKKVISKVKEAEMSIIANPFTNLYLLSPDGKPNGVTRVKELSDAGVNVAYATDNLNDGYNSLGNGDMLLAALFLAYQKRLDGKRAFANILKMGTLAPAKATGIIENYGIKEGGRADLMILDAENPWDAIIFQARRMYVIKKGKVVVKDGNLTLK